MPNNPDYVDAYNLNGTVTFVADGVEMRPGGLDPVSAEWTGGRYLEGTFMPVEEEGLLSLNVNGEDGLLPGSHFTSGSATLPFGAYVRNAGGAVVYGTATYPFRTAGKFPDQGDVPTPE